MVPPLTATLAAAATAAPVRVPRSSILLDACREASAGQHTDTAVAAGKPKLQFSEETRQRMSQAARQRWMRRAEERRYGQNFGSHLGWEMP